MTTIIKIRRDTAANWTSANPILASGEPGLETDTLALKYGDGVTEWNDLDYSSVANAVFATSAGTANVALSVDVANVANIGNIATVNLDGNIFNALRGDGTFGIVEAVATSITNGLSDVSIPSANGNIILNVNDGNANIQLTFDTTGNLTIPNDIIGLATIDIDNRATGNSADINLYSADDILLQARDRAAGSTSEGGDITISAGDSAEDGDSSGGDVIIEAGNGGAANVDFGGSGGFIRIETGRGGNASTGVDGESAYGGGELTLRAGNAGSNMGNIDRGADGGGVVIEAGDSTGNLSVGGSINLRTGAGGANAAAGAVIIDIPASDQGSGGEWIFDATGNIILPGNTSSINYANGSPYGGGGGGGYIIPYEVATFVANTAPGFGEIQFCNFEGSNSAPSTAQKLFISESPTNEQSMGTIFQQWTSNSYRGTLSLNNGSDSQATFNISNGRIYFEPENYRGFRAGLNQIWGDDCSINQLIITNASSPNFYNTEFLVEDDVFNASGLATGNFHIMLNVYGSSQYNPINPEHLWFMFTRFVDFVLFDGETLRTDVESIKTQFYNNTGNFRGEIPTTDIFQYFRFTQSDGADYFGSAPTTASEGTGATLRIRVRADGTYVILGIANPGIGYIDGDNLFVLGTDLGGTSPANDLTLLIDSVDGDGGVTAVSYLSGTGAYPWPSNRINDGGDDQYDTGNYLNTNLANQISYANGMPQTDSAAFGGGDYCVMYDQSFFCMVATGVSSSVNRLFYSGDLGFDGDGFLNWTGLRSTQNVIPNNQALYAYFDSEYLDGELTPTVGTTYNMTLDSAGINLDGFYAYYDNNVNDYFFGSNNAWRIESQNILYVQSYSDMYIQTRVNQRGTSEAGPSINIDAGDGSPGQREINAIAGNGGTVYVRGGDAGESDEIDSLGNTGGSVDINGGMGTGTSAGGSVNINGGITESLVGIAGNVNITTSAGPNGHGRVSITTNDGNSRNWAFNASGTLTFPGDGYITNPPNSSLDPLNPNISTMVFTPDSGYSSQSLVLDPTFPGHIHLRAPGANIDEPTANIFLGGETSSFEVGYYAGNSAPEVFIHSNNKTWTFGDGGTLTLAGDIAGKPVGFSFTGTITNITTGNPTVVVTLATSPFGEGSNGQVIIQGVVGTTEANEFWYWEAVEANEFQLFNDAELTIPVDGTSWTAYVSGGTAYSSSYDSVALSTGGLHLIAGSSSWYFEMDGSIRTPGNLVIGTNPDVGGSIISQDDESLSVVGVGVSSSVITGWAASTEGPGNIALVNFNGGVAGAGNVSISTGDNGGTQYDWKFDNAGVLTVPGEGVINSVDDTVTLRSSNTVSGNSNSVYLGTSGGLGFYDTSIAANWLEIFRSNADPQLATTGNLLIQTTSNTTPYTWIFANNGNLTIPGDLVAVTASPAPVIRGFSSVSALQFTNGNSNVTVNANSNTWTFDSTGNLIIPGSSGGFIKTVANSSIGIAAVDNGTNNPAQLMSFNVTANAPTTIVSAYATNALIQTNATGAINTWSFDSAGNLTLPANTIAINFANGNAAFSNLVQWTAAPVANTSAGTAGQAAYDAGGNLYVCVTANTWAKFTGTTSW
jgi:hypothetical protein